MIPKRLFLRTVLILILAVFICIQWGFYHRGRKVEAVLSRYVEERVRGRDFEVAVFIKQLERRGIYKRLYKRNISFIENAEEKFSAASLIKVPVMVACFMAEREGRLDFSAVYTLKDSDRTGGSGILKAEKAGKEFTFLKLIEFMVSKSDNTASNVLIKELGFDYLNNSFKLLGLKGTEINRPVLDLISHRKGIDNFVSASDLAYLYEGMYKKRLIDARASEMMLEFLSGQKVNDRIPRNLPTDITVVHKTGTIRGIVHDAGIVFAPDQDYLICVLTRGSKGYKDPKDFIAGLSEFVYYLLAYGN